MTERRQQPRQIVQGRCARAGLTQFECFADWIQLPGGYDPHTAIYTAAWFVEMSYQSVVTMFDVLDRKALSVPGIPRVVNDGGRTDMGGMSR